MIIRGCALAKGGREPKEGNIWIQLTGASTQKRERKGAPRMIVPRSQPQRRPTEKPGHVGAGVRGL